MHEVIGVPVRNALCLLSDTKKYWMHYLQGMYSLYNPIKANNIMFPIIILHNSIVNYYNYDE